MTVISYGWSGSPDHRLVSVVAVRKNIRPYENAYTAGAFGFLDKRVLKANVIEPFKKGGFGIRAAYRCGHMKNALQMEIALWTGNGEASEESLITWLSRL